MKKPFLYASGAALYIIFIVSIINVVSSILPRSDPKTIFIPMTMLSLFVLSAAIMGFLFLSEPFHLYMENHKKEAVTFFLQILGIFACFVVLFLIVLLFNGQ